MKKLSEKNGRWLYLGLFVLFINIFLFHSFGTVAGAILMMGIWALIAAMFVQKAGLRFLSYSLASTSLIAGTLTQVSSPEKIGVLTLMFVMSMIVWGYMLLKKAWIGGLLELILSPIAMGFGYLRGGIIFLIELLSGNVDILFGKRGRDLGASGWGKSSILGLILSVPIVMWLIVTLSSADPIFADFSKSFLTHDFWNNWYPRLFLSGAVLCVTVPLFFMKAGSFFISSKLVNKLNWQREALVVTGMVVLVLTTFLVIQWPYVFAEVARETDLSKFGVATYSEYVQKGFWDLLKVAMMVFGVAWGGLLLGRNSRGGVLKAHYLLQGILGIEFLIFIVSIFRRVMLYQSYHGLSLARVYGLALLIWIVGMMATMTARYFYPRLAWVRVEMGWILATVIGIILLNPERMVVYEPPTVNNRIDYVYLSRLPSDGYEGWKQAFEWASTKLENGTNDSIIFSKEERREIYYAWLVASKISANYHDLMTKYGNENERREYSKLVASSIRTNLQYSLMSEVEVAKKKVLLDEVQSILETKDWELNVKLYPNYNYNLSQNFSYPIEQKIDVSFYLLSRDGGYTNLDKWDRVLGWNGADARAFEDMSREVGVEQILEMQHNLQRVIKKISLQPKNEWDFEVDIALDAPFLR